MLELLIWIALVNPVLSITKVDMGNGIKFKLDVTQDVFIYDSSNWNYFNDLIIGKHTSYPKKRTLIQFEDITKNHCPNQKLLWAKMYMKFEYMHKASSCSVSQCPANPTTMNIQLVLKSWNEREATKTHRTNNLMWAKPFLDTNSVDAESRLQRTPTVIYTSRPGGFVEFDVTRAVKSWLKGKENYGLLIWAAEENVDARDIRFASKEDPDSTKHAYINVMCDY